ATRVSNAPGGPVRGIKRNSRGSGVLWRGGPSGAVATYGATDTSSAEALRMTNWAVASAPATMLVDGTRSSIESPGITSPVAAVVQFAADGTGVEVGPFQGGSATLAVPLENWHWIGGRGVGVGKGERGTSAGGAAGRRAGAG